MITRRVAASVVGCAAWAVTVTAGAQEATVSRPCPAVSAKEFTRARFDAGFFVLDGGSRGVGLGEFDAPAGLADLGGGLVAIADTGNDRVKIISFEGFFQDSWTGSDPRADGFLRPTALAADGKGAAWLVDSGKHRLLKLALARDRVSDMTGQTLLAVGRKGRGRGAFDTPTGIAIDSRGDLYVADSGNARVTKLSPRGKFRAAWTMAGEEPLVEPLALAVSRRDEIHVVDRARAQVHVFDREGRHLSSWGGAGADGADLDRPSGIALDPDGNAYVADTGHHRIVKFSPTGAVLGIVGCRGSAVGEFVSPSGVALDEERHLYVADTGNHRVQKLGAQ